MDLRYHRVVVDGENYYHECNNYLGEFGKLIDKEELMERLMDQVVTEEIEITEVTVEIVLDDVLSNDSRQTLDHYITCLKGMAGID